MSKWNNEYSGLRTGGEFIDRKYADRNCLSVEGDEVRAEKEREAITKQTWALADMVMKLWMKLNLDNFLAEIIDMCAADRNLNVSEKNINKIDRFVTMVY
jgi:hypothetical protein